MPVSSRRSDKSQKSRDPQSRDRSKPTPDEISNKYNNVIKNTLRRVNWEDKVESEHQRMITERRVKDRYRSVDTGLNIADHYHHHLL